MDDLSRFCCLNSDCPEHGKRGAGNLTVTSRYGPDKAAPHAPLPHLQGPLLRAQGDAPVRLPAARRRRSSRSWSTSPRAAASARPAGSSGSNRDTVGRATAAWPASTPATSTTSWSPFPPGPARSSSTRSGPSSPRRRSNCDPDDPADDRKGDYWDHVAFDPETGWSSASCPASGRPRTSRRWSRTSSAAPGAG